MSNAAFAIRDIVTLPAPAARYLTRCLREGQPPVATVELITDGEFRIRPDSPRWVPFHATQHFTTSPPSFVWRARMRMAPFVPVFVKDAYARGQGSMVAKVLGVYPVANESGSALLAAGQLARYLAETIWFPTALLPGQGVTWTAIGGQKSSVCLIDSGLTATLQFTFDAAGDVCEVFAPDRLRSIDGRYDPTPWAVRCWDHQGRHGLRIPMECEAEWRLPSGPIPYWRGRVTSIAYGWAR